METSDRGSAIRLGDLVRADFLVAAVTLVLGVSTAAFTATKEGEPRFTAAALVVLILGATPLIWRRHLPVIALLLAGLTTALYGAAEWPDPLIPFAPLVGLVAVFEYCSRSVKTGVWAACSVVSFVITGLIGDSDALDWWTAAFVVIAGPLIGDYLRTRRRLVDEVSARVRRLEAERLHFLADARAAERTRVARELHDVVAHHVTMLVVQAEAAASRAPADDQDRQAAFDDIARSGRTAMSELRGLLGVLRGQQAELVVAPQPTLMMLEDLVAGVRTSGTPVDVDVTGSIDALPAAVDLAAYRVIQEGLTNAVKHAPGAAVEIAIDVDSTEISLTVTNGRSANGRGPRSPAPAGMGLIGLQERVDLLGGSLEAGPRPLGGFRLAARLPLGNA